MPKEVSSQATVQLASGVPFVSDAQLEAALQDAGVDAQTTQAILEENGQARVDGLRSALALLALIAVVALFFTKRVPPDSPAAASRPSIRQPRRSERDPHAIFGRRDLERVRGIEPPSQAWEAYVLPLNHTRVAPPDEPEGPQV